MAEEAENNEEQHPALSGVVRLPFGARFPETEDEVHRDVYLKEMTGIDEENIASPALKSNIGKFVTAVLMAGVAKIGSIEEVTEEHIRSLTIADRDFLMVQIRIYNFGAEIEDKVKCTFCGETLNLDADLTECEVVERADDGPVQIDITLKKGISVGGVESKKVTMRYPTGKDQESTSKEMKANRAKGSTALILRCMVTVEGGIKPSREVVRGMATVDRNLIGAVMNNKGPGLRLEHEITCQGCESADIYSIGLENFFTPR